LTRNDYVLNYLLCSRFWLPVFPKKGWSVMNVRRAVMPVVCLLVSLGAGIAQPRVDPLNLHERVLAIVPMIGQGTSAEPYRPMYAPLTADMDPTGLTGVMAFASIPSDDGNFALLELVARNRAVFATILADTSIQTFLKGRDNRQAAEAAFQKLKKDFSIDRFGVIVP
jgi:hypothetical protein